MKLFFLVKVLIFYLLIISSLQGSAQKFSFGGYIGYNISKPVNMQSWADNFNARLGWEMSIRPAIFIHLPIGDKFALNSEIALVDQGRRLDLRSFKAGDTLVNGIVLREIMNFVQFNQMISYEIPLNKQENILLLTEGGPFFANCVSYTIFETNDKLVQRDGEINSYHRHSYHSFIDNERKFRLGIAAGLGLKVIAKSGSWLLNFRYEQILTNSSRMLPTFDYTNFWLPRVMAFSVGYLFGKTA